MALANEPVGPAAGVEVPRAAPSPPEPWVAPPASSTVDFDSPTLFSFEDSYPSLLTVLDDKPGLLRRIRESVDENRVFCQTHLRPIALQTDLELQRDPSAIASEMLKLAIEHRRFSRLVPRFLGGLGDGALPSAILAAEEMASVDAGFVGVLSGHGLGMVALGFTMNFRLLDWFGTETVRGETKGPPFLIDCAITEPGAGTDVEEVKLMPHANLASEARDVPGGAILNGRKCFISAGHFASHHLVIMPFDRRDPVTTSAMFFVDKNTPGFSLGKLEDKMGQKAGNASELVFEDCFVPKEMIAWDSREFPEAGVKSILHGVLGATRIYVGAWATGIARGAFETALEFAKTTRHRGKRLIEHQFAQEALTDMLKNVTVARYTYLEAMYAYMNATGGGGAPGFMMQPWFKTLYLSRPSRALRYGAGLRRRIVQHRARTDASVDERIQFNSSLAKVVCSDLGMENCHRAIELMGAGGVRHSGGVEKMFRDAKLCQIFEGTNQLNRLNMFEHFVAREIPDLEVF